MDLTIKYIHSEKYAVRNINLNKIILIKGSVENIIYKDEDLIYVPQRTPDEKRSFEEMVKENIYSNAFIAVGTYTNTLPYLKPNFLKENFGSFATFLPEEDVPYYKGVVEKGSLVYYSDFLKAKNEREINKLAAQTEEVSASKGNAKKKVSPHYKGDNSEYTTMHANMGDEMKTAAFLSFWLLPGLLFLACLIIPLLAYLNNLK
jgi:hypothetical protein